MDKTLSQNLTLENHTSRAAWGLWEPRRRHLWVIPLSSLRRRSLPPSCWAGGSGPTSSWLSAMGWGWSTWSQMRSTGCTRRWQWVRCRTSMSIYTWKPSGGRRGALGSRMGGDECGVGRPWRCFSGALPNLWESSRASEWRFRLSSPAASYACTCQNLTWTHNTSPSRQVPRNIPRQDAVGALEKEEESSGRRVSQANGWSKESSGHKDEIWGVSTCGPPFCSLWSSTQPKVLNGWSGTTCEGWGCVCFGQPYSSFKYKGVLISCPRYDLQIRYLPEDFMESLKEDKTTLLYFYQQVKK